MGRLAYSCSRKPNTSLASPWPQPVTLPKITQEMVRLYDDYTHLTLDRRGFMDKLARLAGSGVLAAAIAPMLAADPARAAEVPPEDLRLRTERVMPGQA